MNEELKARAIEVLEDLAKKCGLEREDFYLAHPEVGIVARMGERGRTGKLYLSLGKFGGITTYQERKDGNFRPDLPDIINGRIAGYLSAAAYKKRQREAVKQAEAWLSERGVEQPYRFASHRAGEPAVRLSLSLSLEQMGELLPLLRDMGKM